MEAGITDHVWSVEEIAGLLDKIITSINCRLASTNIQEGLQEILS